MEVNNENNEKYDKYDNLRQDTETHDNTMELIIDSKSENESFARVVVASLWQDLTLPWKK